MQYSPNHDTLYLYILIIAVIAIFLIRAIFNIPRIISCHTLDIFKESIHLSSITREHLPVNIAYRIVYCTEPSGKKKEVGYIKFNESYLLVSKINNTDINCVVVKYKTSTTSSKTTIIPVEDITRKKLIKHFPLFRIMCNNEIANDFLYNMLMDT